MQQSPPSARTKAPASSCHSPESLTAVTVRPALVVPMPVVSTDLGINLTAYFRNCDFPVPVQIKRKSWLINCMITNLTNRSTYHNKQNNSLIEESDSSLSSKICCLE